MNHNRSIVVLIGMLFISLLTVYPVHAQKNVALDKPCTVSSWDTTGVGSNGKGMPGSLAVDGDGGTRWATDWQADTNKDSGWIYIDLQAEITIDSVHIKWETAAASQYVIQVANVDDPSTQESIDLLATDAPWTTVAEITDGVSEELRGIAFTATSAKQVRLRAFARTTTFGYSIWELQVFDNSTAIVQNAKKSFSPIRAEATSNAICFFAPAITGCKLFTVQGKSLVTITQEAAPTLTLYKTAWAGVTGQGMLIARLTSKDGISTHQILMSR